LDSQQQQLNEGRESAPMLLQQELFHILWDDTTCRIRQAGVSEMSVNTQLKKVQQYTFVHLTHYDYIYSDLVVKSKVSPLERLKELRKLIFQHVYLKKDEMMEPRQVALYLDRLAWYIDLNFQNICLQLPNEYLQQGRILWTDLPDFESIVPDNQDVTLSPDDVLPAPWLTNITLRGTTYYWNPITMQSTWDRPT
jgi:WW domain/Ubiquinol-cytochrome C chaperone